MWWRLWLRWRGWDRGRRGSAWWRWRTSRRRRRRRGRGTGGRVQWRSWRRRWVASEEHTDARAAKGGDGAGCVAGGREHGHDQNAEGDTEDHRQYASRPTVVIGGHGSESGTLWSWGGGARCSERCRSDTRAFRRRIRSESLQLLEFHGNVANLGPARPDRRRGGGVRHLPAPPRRRPWLGNKHEPHRSPLFRDARTEVNSAEEKTSG